MSQLCTSTNWVAFMCTSLSSRWNCNISTVFQPLQLLLNGYSLLYLMIQQIAFGAERLLSAHSLNPGGEVIFVSLALDGIVLRRLGYGSLYYTLRILMSMLVMPYGKQCSNHICLVNGSVLQSVLFQNYHLLGPGWLFRCINCLKNSGFVSAAVMKSYFVSWEIRHILYPLTKVLHWGSLYY